MASDESSRGRARRPRRACARARRRAVPAVGRSAARSRRRWDRQRDLSARIGPLDSAPAACGEGRDGGTCPEPSRHVPFDRDPSSRREGRARVWVPCDLDRRNVLARGGRLAAVLDWEGAGAGDPAVDVQVAWKLVVREDRERFRELVGADDATWLRAQGWVLSQALIALGYYTPVNNPPIHAEATRWLKEVLAS